jgi:hypothetical protein
MFNPNLLLRKAYLLGWYLYRTKPVGGHMIRPYHLLLFGPHYREHSKFWIDVLKDLQDIR